MGLAWGKNQKQKWWNLRPRSIAVCGPGPEYVLKIAICLVLSTPSYVLTSPDIMSSSLPPRPKPWEQASGNAVAGPSTQPAGQSALSSAFDNAVASTSTSSAPPIPDRPSGSLDNQVATTGMSSIPLLVLYLVFFGGKSYKSGIRSNADRQDMEEATERVAMVKDRTGCHLTEVGGAGWVEWEEVMGRIRALIVDLGEEGAMAWVWVEWVVWEDMEWEGTELVEWVRLARYVLLLHLAPHRAQTANPSGSRWAIGGCCN